MNAIDRSPQSLLFPFLSFGLSQRNAFTSRLLLRPFICNFHSHDLKVEAYSSGPPEGRELPGSPVTRTYGASVTTLELRYSAVVSTRGTVHGNGKLIRRLYTV